MLTKWITAAVKETSSMTANPIKSGWQFHTSQRHLWPAHLRLQDAAVVEDEIGGDEFEARLFGLQRELHDPFIAWKRMERDSNEEKGRENAREMKLAWGAVWIRTDGLMQAVSRSAHILSNVHVSNIFDCETIYPLLPSVSEMHLCFKLSNPFAFHNDYISAHQIILVGLTSL